MIKREAELEATRKILTILSQATLHSSKAVERGEQEEKELLFERVTRRVKLRVHVDDPTT